MPEGMTFNEGFIFTWCPKCKLAILTALESSVESPTIIECDNDQCNTRSYGHRAFTSKQTSTIIAGWVDLNRWKFTNDSRRKLIKTLNA
jgi:hypothetical protein